MSLDEIITALEANMPGGIDSGRVEEIYVGSLAEDTPEDDSNYFIVEGILRPTAFFRPRLELHRDEVAAMLAWLPREFFIGGGGGWSFLNACEDRQGRLWGQHLGMDMLFQLGIGLDMVKYVPKRELWKAFPGGMPYVQITLPDLEA